MKLAFLGTGSAYSLERYNGAIVVDDRLLLDGGAPLLPHMHRLGIDPAGIQAAFVTHFHGDHTLGLPPFVLYRALVTGGRLDIVGPPGVEETLERLFEVSWLAEWSMFRQQFDLRYHDAPSGEVAGVQYETVPLDHGRAGGTGYRLRVDGRLLAYSGDSEFTTPLEKLIEGADVAVIEATAPGEVPTHTSWEQVQDLIGRHDGTRFLFNHLYAGDLGQAPHDLEVVNV